mmetsp:Transcript_111/g.373  ORF Transcript_111/g.373 Transcript_111/m.373 type:complete len:92 (-) Transcript_111:27-302(-)
MRRRGMFFRPKIIRALVQKGQRSYTYKSGLPASGPTVPGVLLPCRDDDALNAGDFQDLQAPDRVGRLPRVNADNSPWNILLRGSLHKSGRG